MEIFWVVVGVVVVILYLINQNKTRVTNRTEITRDRKIKTDDGEISIRERQVIDSVSTQYTKPNTVDVEQPDYDKTVISDYYKQLAKQKAIESLRQNQTQPVASSRPVEKIVNPLPRVEQKQITPKTESAPLNTEKCVPDAVAIYRWISSESRASPIMMVTPHGAPIVLMAQKIPGTPNGVLFARSAANEPVTIRMLTMRTD